MKKEYYIPFLLLIFGINIHSQNIKILPDLKVDSTKMKITQSDFDYYSYTSYDNKKTDSLIVTVASVGISITALHIDLTNKPIAYITLWSDYKEFDGKDTKRIGFEKYELELNSTEFNKNDRIYGRFNGLSKPIKNGNEAYRIEFSGEFSHIIGMLLLKKKAGEKYIMMDDH